jgi:uncharacterized protein YkwD
MLWSIVFLLWNLFRLPNPTPHQPIITPTIQQIIEPTKAPTPTTAPTPRRLPTILPTNTPKQRPENILLPGINALRKENGNTPIQESSLLCSIASQRVTQLVQRGSLDDHQGIQQFTKTILSPFSLWAEVIYMSSPPKTASAVVQEGWAQSPPHKKAILLPEMTHGCGAMENGFAVFLLGKKR